MSAAVRLATALSALALALVAVACGGSGDGREADPVRRTLSVWILDNEAPRIRDARADVADFTRATGIAVRLAGIGDDELPRRVGEARHRGRLPDVMQLPMASAHAYARAGMLSMDAAQEVVDRLGEDTFSARALSLVTAEGKVTAVPSDGWGQLLIYRKDLFDRAGLGTPRTVEDVRRAARRLDRPGMAGITLATEPVAFTAETFEHVALALGCELLDDRGDVALTSPPCERAFRVYAELARRYSVPGPQDVDSTRATYFAGRAAMVFWSPFLLDAMAGLRDDALPTCPQCRRDPAYLGRNSGLVGPLVTPQGDGAQYGSISTWGITVRDDLEPAQRFVAYMMSGGYLRWLALSPQGKYPMRLGDRDDPERYVQGWAGLQSGVERKAPLTRFYSRSSIASIGEGARNLRRWGFEQGAGALVGAIAQSQPVATAVSMAIRGGTDPAEAARRADAAVTALARATR